MPRVTSSWPPRGYVAEQLIGSGASADVWRGRVAATGRPVALKRIREHAGLARAREEAALLAALDHPGIVRLHDVRCARDDLVLVLDLADNGSLRDVLALRHTLTGSEVVTALAPVAAALAYLHSRQIVHGDVSAANVLFTAAGEPLLADIGVARLVGDRRAAAATPAYIDPVVAGGGTPDPAADVFALGAVAFHALTGAPLWPGADPLQVLTRAVGGVPHDVAERLAAAGVAHPVAEAVRSALVDDPGERCSAVALALDLRHAAHPLAVEFAAGGPPVEAPRAVPPTDDGAPVVVGRPAFARPGPAVVPWREPATRPVEPRPRPELPRGARSRLAVDGRHRAPERVRARRWVGTAWGGAAAAVLALVAVLLAHAGRRAAAPAPRVDPAVRWGQALDRLDAVRARAWADARPDLLTGVYPPGSLLRADERRMRTTMPRGCGIVGARTTYRVLAVRPSPRGASLLVTARLAPSRLLCAGAPRAPVPGTGAVRLSIVLADAGQGLRITEQRPA